MEGSLLTFSEQLHEVWSKKRLNNMKIYQLKKSKQIHILLELGGKLTSLIDLSPECPIFEVLPGY